MDVRCEVMTVDPSADHGPGLVRAGELLRSGGLVAFPTETVYGLGASAFDLAAVDAVFTAKQRPANDPLIVHLADVGDVAAVVAHWPPVAAKLAEAFWPGPLSLVVPRSSRVPLRVTAGGGSVAVRVPAHPVARGLIRAAGVPIAAPSANRFGRVSPTTAAHVVEELGDRIDLVLDGGPTPLGIESTVVDLSGDVPLLRRPGGVGVEDLTVIVPELAVPPLQVVAPDAPANAPGELLSHYAPRTPVVLVQAGHGVGDAMAAALARVGVRARQVRWAGDIAVVARRLYATLREEDRRGADLLLVGAVAPEGLGRAVNDRLYRAAHGRIITDAAPETVARVRALVGGREHGVS